MGMEKLREAVSSALARLRKRPEGEAAFERQEPSSAEPTEAPTDVMTDTDGRGGARGRLKERLAELKGRIQDFRASREAAASEREAEKPARRNGGDDVLSILLHLDNNREVVCFVQPDGTLERENNVEAGQSYLVFSANDIRYKSKAVSHSKALAFALENQGQAVRLVNRSSELGAFYTRPQDAMAEYEIIPGGQTVDWLLKRDKSSSDYPRVAGFQLGDESSGMTVVILFYYNAEGEVGRPQVSINPQSLEFALTQFANSRKFDVDATPTDIYTVADLRSAMKRCQAYLNEDLYGGRTKGAWLQSAVALMGVAVVGSFGATGYYYTAVDAAETSAAESTAQAARLTSERRKLLLDSTQSLGAAYALDANVILRAAESLWRPGFAITIDTDREGNVALLATASLPREMDPEAKAKMLQDLAELPAPQGCARDNLLIAGGLGEAKTSFKCARKTNAPDAYRPR